MSPLSKSLTSTAIILTALGLAYAPLPGQSIVVVSGTELQAPLQTLEARFEQQHPHIQLELKFQGSQEMVNRYLDDQNDFQPTVLIPADRQLLDDLQARWQAQSSEAPFYADPQPIARTILVAIAWPERAKALFPNGQFQWPRLEAALTQGSWAKLGGDPGWGSFDFVTTDPTRSNSGQLTLGLWSQAEVGSPSLQLSDLSDPKVQALFSLVKRSVYQPPRSTDILLQEFITRGPNDADIATVYESIALHRWQQASTTQGRPYQILYLDPTLETVATAAIVRRDISPAEASAAQTWIDFLTAPEQQQVLVQYGFRPVTADIDLANVPNSPWGQNIPGAAVEPSGQVLAPPDRAVLEDVIRQWQRAN
jgi:ABC-type molybdate transport system substrate-binding protein